MALRQLALNDPREGATLGDRFVAQRDRESAEYAALAVSAGEEAGLGPPFVFTVEQYRERLQRATQDGWGTAIEHVWEFIDDRTTRGFTADAIVRAIRDMALPFIAEHEALLEPGEEIDAPATPDGRKRF
jgi:hypothetical protein